MRILRVTKRWKGSWCSSRHLLANEKCRYPRKLPYAESVDVKYVNTPSLFGVTHQQQYRAPHDQAIEQAPCQQDWLLK